MKSHKTKLGIIFLLVGVLLTVGGGFAVKKTSEETFQEKNVAIYYHTMGQMADAAQKFRNDADASDYMNAQIAQKRSEWYQETEKLDRIRNGRHIRMACWFVPAGILFLVGLVICAGGSSEQLKTENKNEKIQSSVEGK